MLIGHMEMLIGPCMFGGAQWWGRPTNDSYRFISELMDVFFMAGVHQQPEQSNYQAEGQT